MINLIEFDHVLVAAQDHRAVRSVKYKIMGYAIAHAHHGYCRTICTTPAAKVSNLAIDDKVSGWRKSLAVAALQTNAAVTGLIDIAADNPGILATVNTDGTIANVAKHTTSD